MAYLELVAPSAPQSPPELSTLRPSSPPNPRVLSCTNLKQAVDLQSNMAIKLRPNMGKKELTCASGMKAMRLSFKVPMTLLALIPSSVRRGALRPLSSHRRLEASHLGRQQIDLRSISHPLFHESLLGRVNPSNSVD